MSHGRGLPSTPREPVADESDRNRGELNRKSEMARVRNLDESLVDLSDGVFGRYGNARECTEHDNVGFVVPSLVIECTAAGD